MELFCDSFVLCPMVCHFCFGWLDKEIVEWLVESFCYPFALCLKVRHQISLCWWNNEIFKVWSSLWNCSVILLCCILGMSLSLCRWDKQIYEEWMRGVDEACSFNLSQPLLSRNEETKLIAVNFDPQVNWPVIDLVIHVYEPQRNDSSVDLSTASL